ncbi:MAG: hypothetical protein MR890_08445 [Akkermansia muciniphila]|nr:hypothetical protein [Akkermansia muciniphila]
MTKIIHYCWFGSPVPEAVKRNVGNWSRLNPDFEIREWNDSNCDVSEYEFGRRAWAARRWGFVVDPVRVDKLYEFGGWYVDADVEMITPLSRYEEVGDKMVIGYLYDCALGTAVVYSPSQHSYVSEIRRRYHRIDKDFWPVSNSIFTEYFINDVPGFLLNGKRWENDKALVLPRNIFEQPSFIRTRGTSIHHCCGSWAPTADNRFSLSATSAGAAHLIKWAKRWRRNYLQLRSNEFVPCYRAAKKGIRLPFDVSKYYLPGGLGE